MRVKKLCKTARSGGRGIRVAQRFWLLGAAVLPSPIMYPAPRTPSIGVESSMLGPSLRRRLLTVRIDAAITSPSLSAERATSEVSLRVTTSRASHQQLQNPEFSIRQRDRLFTDFRAAQAGIERQRSEDGSVSGTSASVADFFCREIAWMRAASSRALNGLVR